MYVPINIWGVPMKSTNEYNGIYTLIQQLFLGKNTPAFSNSNTKYMYIYVCVCIHIYLDIHMSV